MTHEREIPRVMNDLIEVLQLQAKQIEKLITHVERHTDTLNYRQEMPLVVSELSELHRRLAQSDRDCEEIAEAR